MTEQPSLDALRQQRDRETWLARILALRTQALHRVIHDLDTTRAERDQARAELQRITDTKETP